METVLSEALHDFVGLLKQLLTNLLGEDAKEWTVELKKFLRKEPCWVSVVKEAAASIRAPLSFSNLKAATASGRYDWVNNDILDENRWTHTMPLQQERVEEQIFILHPNQTMTSEEVIAWLDSQGYRPANLYHLLKVGELEPELQRQYPIIALGSVRQGANGGRGVACLDRRDRDRGLGLDWFGNRWGDRCRFAAVRK